MAVVEENYPSWSKSDNLVASTSPGIAHSCARRPATHMQPFQSPSVSLSLLLLLLLGWDVAAASVITTACASIINATYAGFRGAQVCSIREKSYVDMKETVVSLRSYDQRIVPSSVLRLARFAQGPETFILLSTTSTGAIFYVEPNGEMMWIDSLSTLALASNDLSFAVYILEFGPGSNRESCIEALRGAVGRGMVKGSSLWDKGCRNVDMCSFRIEAPAIAETDGKTTDEIAMDNLKRSLEGPSVAPCEQSQDSIARHTCMASSPRSYPLIPFPEPGCAYASNSCVVARNTGTPAIVDFVDTSHHYHLFDPFTLRRYSTTESMLRGCTSAEEKGLVDALQRSSLASRFQRGDVVRLVASPSRLLNYTAEYWLNLRFKVCGAMPRGLGIRISELDTERRVVHTITWKNLVITAYALSGVVPSLSFRPPTSDQPASPHPPRELRAASGGNAPGSMQVQ